MKVVLDQPILDFKGDPIKRGDDEEVTYQDIALSALGSPREKENGETKLKKFELGLKCIADEVELNLDERKLLKDELENIGLSSLIFGRFCQLLDPEEEE